MSYFDKMESSLINRDGDDDNQSEQDNKGNRSLLIDLTY